MKKLLLAALVLGTAMSIPAPVAAHKASKVVCKMQHSDVFRVLSLENGQRAFAVQRLGFRLTNNRSSATKITGTFRTGWINPGGASSFERDFTVSANVKAGKSRIVYLYVDGVADNQLFMFWSASAPDCHAG